MGIKQFNFNPRSLTGATHKVAIRDTAVDISIHAPSRERRWTLTSCWRSRQFQSTLPHGSDTHGIRRKSMREISIHAPSRERQAPQGCCLRVVAISIHAPSRERLYQRFYRLNKCLFQSTLPHGSDMKMYCIYDKKGISIHAPSRERRD